MSQGAANGFTLVDPIPQIHDRYEMEICATLQQLGCPSISLLVGPSGELAGKSRLEKLVTTVQLLRRPRCVRRASAGAEILVCWPIFGFFEPLLWMRTARRHSLSIVIHDPTPLRRTRGSGSFATLVGRLAMRSGKLTIVVHSQPAADALAAQGWGPTTLLPHPILPQQYRPRDRDFQRVVVAGQYKPARHLQLLKELAEPLKRRGYELIIAGTGWPDVPGWHVRSGHLSENEFDEVITSAACVLIPYREFYQSGVAVRALEAGRAIVGSDHPFLAGLYGVDWPGLVRTETLTAWLDAVDSAASVPAQDLQRRRAIYASHVCERWGSFFHF